MPNWKRLIVSGSDASLRTVTASVFLSTTASNNVGFIGTSSWAVTASYALSAAGGSGITINNNTDDFLVTATGTANTLNGEPSMSFNGTNFVVSASTIIAPANSRELQVSSTGLIIGNALTDVHQVTGSLRVTGSITGSLFGTSSWAISASRAISANTATTATTASTVTTIRVGDNKPYFLTFVDTNNSAETPESVYTQANLTYNPLIQSLNATQVSASFFGNITGNLTGTASLASTSSFVNTQRTSSNQTYYLTFVDSANGGTGAPEQLITADGDIANITCNPFISRISALQFTGSLFGTASFVTSASFAVSSSRAVTASYVNLLAGPNITINYQSNGIAITGSGGSGTPGGSNTHIQFNSASLFSGSANLTYQYEQSTTTDRGRLTHVSSEDYAGNAYDEYHKHSLRITNDPGGRQQYAGIVNLCERIPNNTGATTIFKFKAGGGVLGGATLKVLGFKCDYCLGLDNGSSQMVGSRVGTLWGAWDYDTGVNPSMTETAISGDGSFNELTNAVFTLIRNGTNVELQLDTTSVNYTVYYNLFITVFTSTAF